jgi:predicted RNA methylase
VKNKIEDLRNHLFATLEALQDKENPMELDRAKTISEVAQTIINSAKVEVDVMRTVGATQGTGFIALPEKPVGAPRLVKGSAMSGGDGS